MYTPYTGTHTFMILCMYRTRIYTQPQTTEGPTGTDSRSSVDSSSSLPPELLAMLERPVDGEKNLVTGRSLGWLVPAAMGACEGCTQGKVVR